jgi:leucyl aminopeptidase
MTYSLPEFPLEISSQYTKKQVCIIVSHESEIPEEFATSGVMSHFADTPRKEVTLLCVRASHPKHEAIHIIRIGEEDLPIHQIAQSARSIEGSTSVYIAESLPVSESIEWFAYGVYRYTEFLSSKKEAPTYEFILSARQKKEISPLLSRKIQSVFLARNLVNTPSNHKNPQKIQEIITSLPWKHTQVEVLSLEMLQQQGFGMLCAVWQWSDVPPVVLVFRRWKGVPSKSLIGKWVTFDAGGLQIKPDSAMLDMKLDMAGAAAVLSTFWYLDGIPEYSQSIVGAVWFVENLLGGSAFKPLDIVRAHNGLSVEIHHTDAEWRLVLGDLASYVGSTFSPKSMVSIATLTGACIFALGFDYAAVISQDTSLASHIIDASQKTPERYWQLPLDERMLKATHATIADRKNISSDMKAGASMGAAFIAQFVPEGIAYAHLDIAGPSYRSKPRGAFPSEGTGFGALTLIEYALQGEN